MGRHHGRASRRRGVAEDDPGADVRARGWVCRTRAGHRIGRLHGMAERLSGPVIVLCQRPQCLRAKVTTEDPNANTRGPQAASASVGRQRFSVVVSRSGWRQGHGRRP
jgi:hypothetical protein